MAHGGARPGSGRKPKAEEIKLIETMDAIAAPDEAWRKLWEVCKTGDVQALKTWLSYRFGIPKQKLELTGEDGGPVQITGMVIK